MWAIVLLALIGSTSAVTDADVDLLDVKDESGKQINVVASPFGLWSLMNTLAMGAARNTLVQIRNVFQLAHTKNKLTDDYKTVSSSLTSCGTCVNVSSRNYVFCSEDVKVKESFKISMNVIFDSTVQQLDFTSPDVATIANDKVNKLQKLDTDAFNKDDFVGKMVLANVVTFQGAWKSTFETKNTIKKPFLNEVGTTIGDVNMMSQNYNFPNGHINELNATVLGMPYGDSNNYYMAILLPNAQASLSECRAGLAKLGLKPILDIIAQEALTPVSVEMPRFKIRSSQLLNDKLEKAGLTDMFKPIADFSNMGDGLVVSKITQDAVIEVTEAGTKAEVVTKAIMLGSSGGNSSDPTIFIVNKPFAFMIVDIANENLLFNGVYEIPSLY